MTRNGNETSTFSFFCFFSVCYATSSYAYDAESAKSYEKMFAPAVGAKTDSELHYIKADAVIKKILAKEDLVFLDVRTPAETAVFGMTLPNSLNIPVDQVFKPENLDRLPTDKTLIVICKSGTRASAIGTALRHVGFDKAYILRDGYQEFSKAYGSQEANPDESKPKEEPEKGKTKK